MEKVHIESSIAEVDNVVLGCKGAFQAYLEDPGPDGMNECQWQPKVQSQIVRVLYFDIFSER
jgi:hypothetical protein